MPERILVVEDEEPVREVIVSMLSSAGYHCLKARSGLEALALLESGQQVELVLSNLIMPGLNCDELMKLVKAKHPDIPFVLQTGVPDPSVRTAAMQAGAYDYLLKPFERDHLLATVRRALEYRRLSLELRQAVTSLERSYDISLDFLGDALALKNSQIGRHSKRVAAFTISIARAMELSADQIRTIARGGFLHDIGKLAVPDSILLKPGTFTANETELMRQHCLKGYEVLKKVPFTADAAEIVYCHHEHYDGSGYPRGLKGLEIPLGARIVAVANAFDAMTSTLPYRPAQSMTAAREKIRRCSGSQFDPAVVKTFLAMPKNVWSDLSREIETQA